MKKYAFIHSAELESYNYPADCPFSAQRAKETHKTLASMNLLSGSGKFEYAPKPADRKVLEKFHSPRYLDALEAAGRGILDVEGFRMGLGTPDCPVFKGMYDYAALACGATLAGGELILTGQADVAFNPSGGYHHAGPELAAGFCYINDVAIACMVLAEKGKRVLFLDLDAHHSDGVQNAFYHRPDVMTISFHESGRTLFPGTGFEDEIGVGEGKGYTVNVPLPAGTYDEAFLWAFRETAVPLIGKFNPDIIAIELGMDGLASDPLAHLGLTNNSYADAVERLLSFNKPILATGGGGYHLRNTARGWALAWTILCGAETHDFGLGGVMLESTDWQGGLRDRALAVSAEKRAEVDAAIRETVEKVKQNVFAVHGL